MLPYNVLRVIEKLQNNKADIDLSNVSAAGKATAVSWGMPDYSAGIYKAGGQFSQNYTPPADGVLCWEKLNNDNYVSITSGAQSILYIRGQGYSGLASGQCFCIGGVVHQFFNCNITYFPMKGVNIND